MLSSDKNGIVLDYEHKVSHPKGIGYIIEFLEDNIVEVKTEDGNYFQCKANELEIIQ